MVLSPSQILPVSTASSRRHQFGTQKRGQENEGAVEESHSSLIWKCNMLTIAAWLHSRDKPQERVNSRYWLMTPGNIQRRKHPQEPHSGMAPGQAQSGESTAARVSRQYRCGRARLGSVWHPGEPSVQDLVNINNSCLAGRAGLGDGQPTRRRAAVGGWAGCGLPLISPSRATTRQPRRRAEWRTLRLRRGKAVWIAVARR